MLTPIVEHSTRHLLCMRFASCELPAYGNDVVDVNASVVSPRLIRETNTMRYTSKRRLPTPTKLLKHRLRLPV
jgi:hypothetical protein